MSREKVLANGLLMAVFLIVAFAPGYSGSPEGTAFSLHPSDRPGFGQEGAGSYDLSFVQGRINIGANGLALYFADNSQWSQSRPLRVQIWKSDGTIAWIHSGYKNITKRESTVVAEGSVTTPGGSEIVFVDRWMSSGPGISLRRSVEVKKAGSGDQGFLSAFEFETTGASRLADFEPFAPGVLYGDNTYLTPEGIGSRKNMVSGIKDVFVREDRLPAPLIALRGRDGLSLTIIHSDPKGDTNKEDSDRAAKTLVNEVFNFASLGYRESEGRVGAGLWFPGTEGAVTYFGRNEAWSRRYHPVKAGLRQEYGVEVTLQWNPDFPAMAKSSWRRAFEVLNPKVSHIKDVNVVKATVMAHVSGRIQAYPNGAIGMPFLAHATTGEIPTEPSVYGPNLEDPLVFGLGFCAANESIAYWLLRMGRMDQNEHYISQGRAIFDFWTSRTKTEPVTPTYYFPKDDRFGACYREPTRTGLKAVSLREIAEAHYGCLLAWEFEKKSGFDNPKWLDWCTAFGEWLLNQQLPSGAYPRWWSVAEGKVLDPSPTSTYNAVPFLCELSKVTGDDRFLKAAVRAAEFMWADHHRKGIFVGGALDKADLIDKEAAVISLEGYLALYRETKDKRWLEAAKLAGDMAETYMYIWEVPMPLDADPSTLNWKPGATTIGLQLVATGSSGADQWLSWNVDEFAQLYDLTGDPHYLAVTKLLFHNTKAMLALPGRTFDLKGPGWQQEAWTLAAPDKGRIGGARLETGWVAICHVAGMMKLKERNPVLFDKVLKE